MVSLRRIFRTLCLVMLPALLAQGAQAAEPPQFGARLGVGASASIANRYWVLLKESGAVAATMRYRVTAHWDFETELGVSSWGYRLPWSRKEHLNTTLVSVQVPLMGRYWWDESRTGLYMVFGVQLHFMLWGTHREYLFTESINKYVASQYRLEPIWTRSQYRRWKRDSDDSRYLHPVAVSVPFRVGWKFQNLPLDVAFTAHQMLDSPLIKNRFVFSTTYLGASCTWWF